MELFSNFTWKRDSNFRVCKSVGQVLEQKNKDLTVKFLRQTKEILFFPAKDDISEIHNDQIMEVLPQPKMNSRFQFYIEVDAEYKHYY